MRLAVTGAGGYLGRWVTAAALALPGLRRLTLTDRVLPALPDDPRLHTVDGDIRDAALQAAVCAQADAVIHLAAVLGGAAEADPAASRAVNLDATLDLMERMEGRRFVLASSIAVLGPPPARATDDTPPAPVLVYALHKRMAEQALETLTLRGALDGLALRIPGVVARPGDGAGLKSAFLSRMFHAARARQGIVLPVAPTGRTWLASAGVVAAGLVHAATLPAGLPGARRCLLLPALAPHFAELAAALRAAFPGAPEPGWQPDPAVMAGFGSFGEIDAAAARQLGFPADPDLAGLIAAAMAAPPGGEA